jgi:hypothetical protein
VADEVEKEGIVPAGAFDFLPHGDAFGMGANDVDRASAGTWSPLELNVAATITQRFLNISYASRWTPIRKRSLAGTSYSLDRAPARQLVNRGHKRAGSIYAQP